MSAVTDKVSQAGKSVTDTAKNTVGGGGKKAQEKTPRNLPEDVSESASQVAQTDGDEDDTSSEMVPAAGKVNEKGEVVDDDGKVIGKVSSENAKELAGSIVTQEGDILDKDGSVVGKAEPLEDVASELGNYTTKSQSNLGGVTDKAGDTAGKVTDGAKDTADETTDGATKPATDTAKDTTDNVEETAEDATGEADDAVNDTTSQVGSQLPIHVAESVISQFQQPFTVDDDGKVTDEAGQVIGSVAEGANLDELTGTEITEINPEGQLIGEDDSVLGEVDIKPEDPELLKKVEEAKEQAPDAEEATGDVQDKVDESTEDAPDAEGALDDTQDKVGETEEGAEGQVDEAKEGAEGTLDETKEGAEDTLDETKEGAEGTLDETKEGAEDTLDETKEGAEGTLDETKEGAEGTLDEAKDTAEEAGDDIELPDVSVLEGKTINKAGNVVDENGNLLGKVKEGEIKKLIGKSIDDKGQVWDAKGNIIGQVEVLPEAVENLASPFEDFPDAIVEKDGKVYFEGRQVGVVVGDDIDLKKLTGKKVDADGDILDKNGNVIGKAERADAEEPEAEAEPEPDQIDFSILTGKKVNKAGNVVDDKGAVYGHVVQGILKHLVGKKVGENGEIYNDAGKVVGKAEPIPESEREEAEEDAPFSDFPDATVADAGKVVHNGEQVGVVVEGDPKKLKGKKVDPDGDITDKNGNVLGKAERWEPEEAAPEPEVDRSALAGKRINKAGNAVDKSGDIYGRVVEGDVKRLVGKMCDKTGAIRNEGGDIIGKAELIPEAEREGLKEGPFTELQGCTVTKEGKVVTPGGDVVGRLVSGDAKALFGRTVDDDGDICDKNGNVLGKAERWEEPEQVKDVNPMSGRKVNKQGEVVDENGDIVGRLTSGELSVCAGKKIDDDGDVVDGKGATLGHVSLLDDIPEPEPEPVPEGETEEEKKEREELEKDKKLAAQMGTCIEQSIDKIKPICKMITQLIESEERKPEEERDEENLVKQVRPLIEEGGKILTEANGVIRGLDPDGRISANAKHKTASRDASPEEYRLADQLKELTGSVSETIENAKKKIDGMPHAKKELNPLWGLLAEPLGQILAAVGLLLSGVLGLVGKLLSGLGLGGLVDNLLGGLGLKGILSGLGLGGVVGSLTGKKGKK